MGTISIFPSINLPQHEAGHSPVFSTDTRMSNSTHLCVQCVHRTTLPLPYLHKHRLKTLYYSLFCTLFIQKKLKTKHNFAILRHSISILKNYIGIYKKKKKLQR